jgi:hypothetical protein
MNQINLSLNNYLIANFIIKNICRDYGVFPFDIEISESNNNIIFPNGLKIKLDKRMSRKQFNLSIVNFYINNFKNLHGIEIEADSSSSALITASGLCDIYYTYNNSISDSSISGNHFPLFYILTKNIIYPYMDLGNDYLALKNINSIGDGKFDYAISKDSQISLSLNGVKEEFRDISLFKCIDVLHSINSVNGKNILFNFVSNTEMMRMAYPVILAFYNNDSVKVDAFLGGLQMCSDSIYGRKWVQEKTDLQKTAKYEFDGNFWIYGLIEKMLAPARGSDFSIKQKWAPIANAFWQDIDMARKKAGISGASLEFMLRVKDPESRGRPEVVQRMIEDLRDE